MNIAELSVRRPVAMTMVYILICVIAMVFIPRLGIDLYPSIDLPVLSIVTTYYGVGPEEIDENVTDPIIDALKGVPGLIEITSLSQMGMSFVILEFAFGEDMDEAYDEVNSKLPIITRMIPDEADAPTLFEFDISSQPMMRLGINGELPINELKELAEDTVEPLIERVAGVSKVEVRGGADMIIQIDVHHNRLEAYGFTLAQISSALAARNIQLSSGEITQNGMDYEIITTEYFSSLDDIRQTVITNIDGASINIADVADVYETFDDDDLDSVYINGVPGLYISISKESDANASAVAKSIRAILDSINAELPVGVNLSVLSDDTTLIDSTMNQVYRAAIEGVSLAMLIIFIFLRNIKSTFIIGLSLPISILITLMVMSMMGLTVNMMTMAGLILGMGMVVDSSIVILENIFLERGKGAKSVAAAILGSRTMINAIVASTLTTLCVFVPILIYKAQLEMLGELFEELVVTVCVSLIASLIVAVTLVPALCGSILQIETRAQKPLKNKFLRGIDDKFVAGFKALENGYAMTLKFCLQNRFLVLSLVCIMLVMSVLQLASMGLNLAPPSDADDKVDITLELPIGTNKEIVEDYLFEFQEIILRECEGTFENIIISTGSSGMFDSGGAKGEIQINLPELSKQIMSPGEIEAKLRPYVNQWSDVTITFSSGSALGGGSDAIDVQIFSETPDVAVLIANQIETLLKESVPLLIDIETDFEDGSPRFQVAIDTEKAATLGVSVQAIASEIRSAVNGTVATIYRADGEEYDVEVSIRAEDLISTSDLGAIAVNTPTGRMSLENFIVYNEGRSPQTIVRKDGERINHVTAGIIDGVTATEAQAMVEQVIAENIVLPETVKIQYEGESTEISELMASFLIVILLAVFLVFAVMAAQFESFVDPFIIFMSIPLMIIGVILVYKITGEILTIVSMVGIVALAGIVVNNGIVLVDYINQLVDKKTPVMEACIEAGRNRLQPILMSTLTTVLGMVPMAFFPGEGAEMMQPIAITIVGGLLSGSFMTLLVSPVLYSMLNKKREKRFDDPLALINQLEEFDNMQKFGTAE